MTETDRFPWVKGRCPACNLATLFVGQFGYLTCSNVSCPLPDTMTAFKVRETGLPFFRPGDRLPTGEEFIGYTGEGTAVWKEPVAKPPVTVELDDYETVNLREGLLTLRRLGCDTGDWLGQILNKLPDSNTQPNATVDQQVARVPTHIRQQGA